MTDTQPERQDGDGLRERLFAFSNFLNEPPQYEELRMVRDYRHEACNMWLPLVNELIAKLATSSSNGEEGAGEGDEFGYFELGRSFFEEFTRLSNNGNFKGFICGCSPVEILVHLINERDEAKAAPPQPAPDVMRETICKILKSKIRTAQIADDIEPHVINAEAVADEICGLSPATRAAEPDWDKIASEHMPESVLPLARGDKQKVQS